MATQLHPVPDIAAQLGELVAAVRILRGQIISAVGRTDAIDDVDLAIAKKEDAFDLTIRLKTNATPDKAVFILETQPVDGVRFDRITVGSANGAGHRKVVTAKVVAP